MQYTPIFRFPATITVLCALFAASFLFSGCGDPDVVLYVSLDRSFSEPLIKKFEKRTGLKVDARYDVEASKTVGHYLKIREEMPRPRCDVFWNNEVMLTARLKQLGALEPYVSPSAADIPDNFKDDEGYWTGFAARARIFIVNTELLPDQSKWPASYKDLVDPCWKGKCGMAKPLAGTTATHGTVLFQLLGEKGAKEYFQGILDNECVTPPGNANLMRNVRKGGFPFGFTDTDDFNVALVDKYPVAAVYPDQGEGEPGTLLIPNSVCLIKGAPHPEVAKKLIDFILSAEVEEELAVATSAQIPLRPGVKKPDYIKVPGRDFRAMVVDFEKAALEYDMRHEFFRELFLQ